ncbi:MAG: hypothetical protein HND58_03365 [Planctomycetota bacterium]|nr:MAG: hypothetical protein HND58_03365 [Planctomycetota bacterium]
MRKRDSAGLAIAPLFLRLVLAVVFIWAGLGKFVHTFPVQGEDAAILANYGVIPNPQAPSRAAPPIDSDGGADPIAPEESGEPEDVAPDRGRACRRLGGQAEGAGSVRLVSQQSSGAPARVLATAADFPEAVEVRGVCGSGAGAAQGDPPGAEPGGQLAADAAVAGL